MTWEYNDGGRKDAGYSGKTGDCVVRAIAIATERDYQEVYDEMNEFIRSLRQTRRARRASSATGMHKSIDRRYLKQRGWSYTPTMAIGQGCKVHLRAEELPKGRLIVQVSKHLTAVIDGVIHDTYDPSRQGTRCVYGYWSKK